MQSVAPILTNKKQQTQKTSIQVQFANCN